MRHVDHEIGADRVGDLAEALEVEHARIGRKAGDDHLRLFGQRLGGQRVVVDLAVVGADAVLHGAEKLAGEIHLGAVREVAAMIEAHAEDGVARIDQRQVGRGIGLRAGVRLDVGVVGAEELLGAIDGELLGHVHEFAAAVVTLARITFRVLVGQHRALGLEHARTGVVLRGDQLDVVFLALALALMAASSSGSKPPMVIAVRNISWASKGSPRGARIVLGWRAVSGRENRDDSRESPGLVAQNVYPGFPCLTPTSQQPFDDPGPGLREIDAVIAAATGAQHAPMAEFLRQPRKIPRGARVRVGRIAHVGDGVALDTVGARLEQDELRFVFAKVR